MKYLLFLIYLYLLCVDASNRRRPPGRRRIRPKNDMYNRTDLHPSSESSPARHGSTSEILNVLLKKYDRFDRPTSGGPTDVRLGIYVNDFEVNDETSEFSVNMYLKQAWRDTRFEYKRTHTDKLVFPGGIQDKIWVPDIYFKNEKSARFHHMTVENRLLKIDQDGSVWYVMKVSATLKCRMKLHKFPMDIQTCVLKLESFSSTIDEVDLKWLSPAIEFAEEAQPSLYTLQDIVLHNCSMTFSTGTYPCLDIQFVLKRNISHYLMRFYIPCICVVFLAWLAFWIGTDAIQARIVLGLCSIFMIHFVSSEINSNLPPVTYLKTTDVWIIACHSFVFVSLLELVFVVAISKKSPRENTLVEKNFAVNDQDAAKNSLVWKKQNPEDDPSRVIQRDVQWKKMADTVDIIARALYPTAFIIFVVTYFMYYTTSM